MNKEQMIETVFAPYRERGHGQYGEDVTELQHALQCAMFAAKHNEPDAIDPHDHLIGSITELQSLIVR